MSKLGSMLVSIHFVREYSPDDKRVSMPSVSDIFLPS